MKNTKYFWLTLLLLVFAACEDDKYDIEPVEPIEVIPGSADFSNFVSVGASFTAGYTDGALFIAGQDNSFPNLMAGQMALAGGGEFTQPYMNDNVGGLLFNGNFNSSYGPRLYFNGEGPAAVAGMPSTEVFNVMPGPYNNMGVPGAKSFHLLANGYGNPAALALGKANPYYVRMASSPNASVLEDAVAQNPTFFVISEIAGNDVLGYAYSGGTGVDQTGNPDASSYGPNDITDPGLFNQVLGATVSKLMANGAKGVIGNIPAVTSFPFFTTVPYAPLDPTNPEFGPQIPLLNAAYAPLNQAFAFLGVPERSVVFSETAASPIVIHDESLANITPQLAQVLVGGGLDPLTAGLLATQYGQSRQATGDDLVVLTSSNVIATLNQNYFDYLVSLGVPPAQAGQLSVNGITYPLEDQWVLIPEEQEAITTATDAYNQAISGIAAQAGLGLVDTFSLLNEAATGGLVRGDFIFTSQYVLGGAFSMDGIHLNARGYAMLANEFLMEIDDTFGSNFEEAGALLDIGSFPVFYPEQLP